MFLYCPKNQSAKVKKNILKGIAAFYNTLVVDQLVINDSSKILFLWFFFKNHIIVNIIVNEVKDILIQHYTARFWYDHMSDLIDKTLKLINITLSKAFIDVIKL